MNLGIEVNTIHYQFYFKSLRTCEQAWRDVMRTRNIPITGQQESGREDNQNGER
jgi:hypothetical protein